MVDYARIYEKIYGNKKSIEELVPFMIAGFEEREFACTNMLQMKLLTSVEHS